MLSKIVVTGEGITDMGVCRDEYICTGDDLDMGPVSLLLLKLVHQHLPDWNADLIDMAQPTQHLTLIYHGYLGEISKTRQRLRPSKTLSKGFIEHAQRAEALGHYALTQQHELAAYFHDADGTRSDSPQRWNQLSMAIATGFQAAGLNERGIALVPKPKSEAWFICAVKPEPYQHCSCLEDELSGNDRSPERAPKKVLGALLNNPGYHRQDLCDLVGKLDVKHLDMPSFNAVRDQVITAITSLCGVCRQ